MKVVFCVNCQPEDLIWTSEKSKVDPVERKERGKANIANIRSMIK